MLFAPRIFQLFDADKDGYLNATEFMAAVEQLGCLHSEADKAACKRALLSVFPGLNADWMARKRARAAEGTSMLPCNELSAHRCRCSCFPAIRP